MFFREYKTYRCTIQSSLKLDNYPEKPVDRQAQGRSTAWDITDTIAGPQFSLHRIQRLA